MSFIVTSANGLQTSSYSNLVEDSGLANSTVSHYLRVLKDADLIKGRKEGQWISYRATEENVVPQGIV